MPINTFYVNFATTSFDPFKPTKGIKRNQRYAQIFAHRFPPVQI